MKLNLSGNFTLEKTRLVDKWFLQDENGFKGYVSTRYLLNNYPKTMAIGFGVVNEKETLKAWGK